jgi:CBS domain-containing protein
MGQDARMKLLRDVGIRHLVTVDPQVTLRHAARAMVDRGVGCAVVVEGEQVAGIITERDILRSVSQELDPDTTLVGGAMTRNVVSGSPGWTLVQAVNAMVEGGFRHLLITEMDEPVGIVSLRDLMDSMVEVVQPEDASA